MISTRCGAGPPVLGSRYMGAERAAAFGERNAVPGELPVRLQPRKSSRSVTSPTSLAQTYWDGAWTVTHDQDRP